MTLRRLLEIGGLSVLGLHAPAPAPAQQQRAPLDGYWTGRTSQGRPIGFRIEAGSLRTLELDWILAYEGVCQGGPAPGSETAGAETFYFDPRTPGYEPPPIRPPAFTVAREVGTPKAPVSMVLSGRFASDSTVSGDMTLSADGCPGRATITWKAGRKPGRVADE